MIDSHCHLDFDAFDRTRDEEVAEAGRQGVHTIVNIGVDLDSSRRSIALAERYESVYATVGVHPHDAKTLDDAVLAELRRLGGHPKVVAVGEIGLDFYRDLSPRHVQKQVFRRLLELAVELGKPIVIHTRNAFNETLEIVHDYADRLPGGVFHCFPGDLNDARRAFDLGFVVGIGGVVTYPNARLASVVAAIPLEWMVLETDAPYLAPEPFRGRTNRPAYVRHVRDKVAALRKIAPEQVDAVTDRTCRRLYRLAETFGG